MTEWVLKVPPAEGCFSAKALDHPRPLNTAGIPPHQQVTGWLRDSGSKHSTVDEPKPNRRYHCSLCPCNSASIVTKTRIVIDSHLWEQTLATTQTSNVNIERRRLPLQAEINRSIPFHIETVIEWVIYQPETRSWIVTQTHLSIAFIHVFWGCHSPGIVGVWFLQNNNAVNNCRKLIRKNLSFLLHVVQSVIHTNNNINLYKYQTHADIGFRYRNKSCQKNALHRLPNILHR